jgi:hypothetical protein
MTEAATTPPCAGADDTTPSNGEAHPETRRPRRIGELGEEGILILRDHKAGPCSRFVLKEYFD